MTAPNELGAHKALMQGTEAWQFMDGDGLVTVDPHGRFQADNGNAPAVAAAAGLRIAWLPDCVVSDHLVSGALVPIMTGYPPPSADANVVRPPGQQPARKVRVLTDLLIELFERDPRFAG